MQVAQEALALLHPGLVALQVDDGLVLALQVALVRGDAVARLGRAVEAEDFDGNRRGGFRDLGAEIGDERTHAAPFGAGDDQVADIERAIGYWSDWQRRPA